MCTRELQSWRDSAAVDWCHPSRNLIDTDGHYLAEVGRICGSAKPVDLSVVRVGMRNQPIKYSSSVKKHRTLFYSQPFNEMFIFGSKSSCSNGSFTPFIPLYIAANKEHLTKIQIILRCVYSAYSQLYWLKFSFKFANISRSYEPMTDVRGPLFILTQSLPACVFKHESIQTVQTSAKLTS